MLSRCLRSKILIDIIRPSITSAAVLTTYLGRPPPRGHKKVRHFENFGLEMFALHRKRRF